MQEEEGESIGEEREQPLSNLSRSFSLSPPAHLPAVPCSCCTLLLLYPARPPTSQVIPHHPHHMLHSTIHITPPARVMSAPLLCIVSIVSGPPLETTASDADEAAFSFTAPYCSSTTHLQLSTAAAAAQPHLLAMTH